MFRLSYSLNSAEPLPIEEVCDALLLHGFGGVELSFQYGQFDPFTISDGRIEELRSYFSSSLIKPVCISTATTKFLSDVPHEPSLISIRDADRARRADLITKGIVLAARIGVPLVSFQSGYLRDEHAGLLRDAVMQTLAQEVKGMLAVISDPVALIIEPEPGMFIESIADARELIAMVDDRRFGLHMDIGHVFCTEDNYLDAIRAAAPETRYVHMADIRGGFNLEYTCCFVDDLPELVADNSQRNDAVLYDVGDKGLYLFTKGESKVLVGEPQILDMLANDQTAGASLLAIAKEHLRDTDSPDLKHEIAAYLDSVSGVAYERLQRAHDAIAMLRLGINGDSPVIGQTVCNTVRGKVHYHDLFGKGDIDYAATVSALIESGYAGYCTVELYNHAKVWRDIAPQSAQYLLSRVIGHFGWDPAEFGHIDHRHVTAPYLRVADARMGPEGGVAVLYDLRLSQPNVTALPADALHTLEHCLLWSLPRLVPGFLGNVI